MYMVWSLGSTYLNTAGEMEVCYDTLEWLMQKVGDILSTCTAPATNFQDA